jgi:hypothetical protein
MHAKHSLSYRPLSDAFISFTIKSLSHFTLNTSTMATDQSSDPATEFWLFGYGFVPPINTLFSVLIHFQKPYLETSTAFWCVCFSNFYNPLTEGK